MPNISPVTLTSEQRDILHHTVHRAAGGYYCGDGADMDVLVALGFMIYAGKKSFVPEPYYQATPAGRAYLKETP